MIRTCIIIGLSVVDDELKQAPLVERMTEFEETKDNTMMAQDKEGAASDEAEVASEASRFRGAKQGRNRA